MDVAYEYALDALGAFRDQETKIFYEDMMQYLTELDVLAEAFLMGKVLLEDVKVDSSKTGKGTLGSIIDFIRRIIAKFIDTAKNLFKTNEQWFSDNVHKFDRIDGKVYESMKITLVPYWNVSNYTMPNPKIQAKDPQLGVKFKDGTDIEKAMFPQLMQKTMSGNIVEGAKIYFRGGSNNLESITGSNVRTRVTGMIKYCNNYVNTANQIKEILEGISKDVETAQENLDKVMEDFSIAEGKPILETVYATMPWIDNEGKIFYVTEADDPKNGSVSTGETKDGDKPASGSKSIEGNGTVTGGTKGVEDGTDGDKEDGVKKAAISNKTAIKTYYQIYLKVATAMMTVAEERYVAYLRTLRGVLTSAGMVKTEEPKK